MIVLRVGPMLKELQVVFIESWEHSFLEIKNTRRSLKYWFTLIKWPAACHYHYLAATAHADLVPGLDWASRGTSRQVSKKYWRRREILIYHHRHAVWLGKSWWARQV